MPAFDINDDKDYGRLTEAIKQGQLDRTGFLKQRDKCMALYKGPRWSQQRFGLQDRVPVPFIQLGMDVYTQHLSSIRPQMLVVAERSQYKVLADKLRISGNRLLNELRFAETLRLAVMEAQVGFPLFKVAMTGADRLGPSGWRQEPAYPFVDVVLSEDVVVDATAPSVRLPAFIGNKYRVPLKWVESQAGRKKLYRKKDVDKLAPLDRPPLDKRHPGSARPLYDMVELIDLFFPLANHWVTIPSPEYHDGRVILASEPWTGPPGGPYVEMTFSEVQDEVMPLPPVWSWIDSHLAVNALYNKLVEQAEDMKEIIGAQGNAVRDAERLVRAKHGEVWRFDHPNSVKEYRFSGPDQGVAQFAMHLRSLLSYTAGNVDLMGGFAAQSGTATQDQLLHAQGTKRLQDMQQQVTAAVERVMRKLMWYQFNRRRFNEPMTRRVRDLEIQTEFRADEMHGRFLDYEFQIEPFSMRFRSPEERLAQLNDIVNSVVGPMLPIIQQQGNTIDMGELMKIEGEYTGLPEMNRIVKRADREPTGQDGDTPNMPLKTSREYVRRGVPGNQNQNAIDSLPQMAGAGER